MKTERAVGRMMAIEDEASLNTWIHRMHPLIKLLVTVAFLGVLLSFPMNDPVGVLLMSLYPFMVFAISAVSFTACLRRIAVTIPVFVLFGITLGWIGLLTLVAKGVLAVMSVYLLIATTGIEGICYALRCLHVPKLLVTEILLVYRYFSVMAGEAGSLATAYALRAPGQKGISLRYVGPFLGQMLLRSVDRAEEVYESMTLRGFQGEFPLHRKTDPIPGGIVYGILCVGAFVAVRIFL